MRPDWDPADLRDAMTAASYAGWPWRDVYREVTRLMWAQDETPGTLRQSARRPRVSVPTDPEATRRGREALRTAIEEVRARATGPQAALRATGELELLREGHDP
jgi:hypothetical protein